MIKVLTEKNTDTFIEIRMESLRESPLAFGASFEDGIDRELTFQNLKNRTDENFILGYFEESQLVGIVGFIREQKRKKRHKSFIWGMFVSQNSRGSGIGKKLMLEVMNRAKKIDGLSKINLSVTKSQQNAIAFYHGLGFVEYAVEKDALRVDGQAIDEIFMSIEI